MADASAPLSTSADVNLIQSFPLEIPKSESSVLPFECERNLNSVPAPGEIIRIFVGHPSTPGVAYPAHVTVGASMEDLVKELQHECPSLSTMSAIYIFPYYSRLTDSKYLKHDDRIWFCEYDFQVPPENGAFLSNEPQKKKRRRSKSSISIAHKLFEIVTDYNIAISRQSKYDVRRIAWGAKHIPNFLFDHKRCSDGVKAASVCEIYFMNEKIYYEKGEREKSFHTISNSSQYFLSFCC